MSSTWIDRHRAIKITLTDYKQLHEAIFDMKRNDFHFRTRIEILLCLGHGSIVCHEGCCYLVIIPFKLENGHKL